MQNFSHAHARPIDIEPARYYKAQDIAHLLGVHVITVYHSAAGIKRLPVPRATRLGRSVRFLGRDIIEFIEERSGSGSACVDLPVAVSPARRGRGRPRKEGVAA